MKHRFLVISLLFCLLFLSSSSRALVIACGNIDEPCCAIPNSLDPGLSSGYCNTGVCTGFDIYNPSDNGTCFNQTCGAAIGDPCCTTSTGNTCSVGVCTTTAGLGGTCQLASTPTTTPTAFPREGSVNSVFCGGERRNGVQTAIGCINVDGPENIIGTVIGIATGVGGGIALLLILYGVFIVTTSAGNPDKLKSGSEIITSAIVGLIFILLSVFLVNLIGIKILAIPGLE